MKKTTVSKLTLLRLLASGALLGVVVASMFGVDLTSSVVPGFVSGIFGATGSAVALKLAHLL